MIRKRNGIPTELINRKHSQVIEFPSIYKYRRPEYKMIDDEESCIAFISMVMYFISSRCVSQQLFKYVSFIEIL